MIKRSIKTFVLIFVLSVSSLTTGCNNENKGKVAGLTKQIEELKRENSRIKEELENLKNEREATLGIEVEKVIGKDGESTDEVGTNMSIKEVRLDETILIEDFAELTIKKVEFTKRVNPPNPDSYYSYYQVKEEGLTFLHVITEVKNLQAQSVGADKFLDIEAKYNSKYIYNGFSTIEESGGGDFNYTSITGIDPLKKGKIHFLIEVPIEVETEANPLELKVNINGKSYSYKVR
ncbi:putative lipoprotein [Proteiniborus sp. DW1]|uniref:hypothetical protein n=1 Tax=Proteiniborus sp. DW1 TaxID=1889883 RepID=UPI00092DEECE|nr:hypothetical protein [Proteiniborus sp. DW1]SCG82865.1 putative lipoprotein [Proteiniborus sp. DW1]